MLIAKKGQLLSSFAHLRDDGTTASSCWIYTGSWTEQGNQMANRDNSDPSGLGNTLGWAWAWLLNGVLYNRASADINGKPWDPKRMLIQWNGSKWTGNDIPDFGNAAPGTRQPGRLSCSRKGWDACLPSTKWRKVLFPEHYEPIETPLGTNPLHPNVVFNPVVRLYEQDALRMG